MNERLYRKQQNALVIAGQSIIILSVWSAVRGIMYLTVDREYLLSTFQSDLDEHLLMVTVAISIISTSIFDIFIRYKIGRAAFDVAKGKAWKKKYTPLLIICMILNASSFINVFYWGDSVRRLDDISTFTLEVYNVVSFVIILIMTHKVSAYRALKSKEVKMETE